jgi:hypothetical protein
MCTKQYLYPKNPEINGGDKMTRLTIGCICIVVSLILAGPSYAEVDSDAILGIWLLDEGTGDTTEDISGNGNDGTLISAPEWVAGHFGNALEFNGSSSYVSCGNAEALNTKVFSVSFWCNIPSTQYWNHMVSRGSHVASGTPGSVNWGVMMVDTQEVILFETYNDTGWTGIRANTSVGQWHHVVATYDGDMMQLYHDGELADSTSGAGILLDPSRRFVIGARSDANNNAASFFTGSIDEVGFFNVVLAPEDIQTIMDVGLKGVVGGIPVAVKPTPADGALYTDTWVTLSWQAGDFAVSHDVYLGDNFDEVEQATRDSDVFRGNQPTTFYVAGFPGFAYPEGLVPGTTYYWRIDEVNDADPNSPWKGDVWSFAIPPKTAYNPNPADGTGLANTTITLSWTPGLGAKFHTVYFGDDYDTVDNATAGVPSGVASYSPGALEQEKVYYWRVDEFDGIGTYKGNVWAFTTPGAVGNPRPANGTADAAMATVLSWTAADSATSHQVYLGMDKDTVRSADTSSPEYKGPKALGVESYDPGLLDLGTTYYWRVDEVYNAGPVKGPVWSFTVGDYLVVEDFESYTDDDANGGAIWQTWIDGFGIADNGAQVGYLMPPYAEQTIVHGGSQSMPLLFTNEAPVTNSEASMTLTSLRDWTTAGVNQLSLWVRGDDANPAEPLYVAISNSNGAEAIVANSEPRAAVNTAWKQWRITLQSFADQGVDLTNVDKIAIGLGTKSGMTAPGGSGTMYIDDIRLYKR